MASQNTSSLISQVYASRTVILELMDKQGYNVSEYEGFSVNEVNTMKTNNQLDMILEKISNTSKSSESHIEQPKKIYIKYYLAKALRPNNLQEMIDDLFTVEEILTKNDTLLIVVKDEINETMINTVKHIWESEKIFIILQPIKRLQFNILNHVLVPPHRVLTQEETIQIKKRYNVMSDGQFPDISRFDPVAKAIGIRPGEVCEIIRPSKTAISAPYYRICN
jgi:DNA-directed RNA polymerase subunit H (RpoH/RPB5)